MMRNQALPVNSFYNSPTNGEKEDPCRPIDQSLSIIVRCLRLMGCPLDLPGIPCKLFRFWTLSCGLILLTINLSTNFSVLVSSLVTITGQSSISVSDWNYIINEIDFTFFLVSTHVALFVRVAPNFKRIAMILQRIGRLGILQPEDYRRFKSVSVAAGFTFLTVVTL